MLNNPKLILFLMTLTFVCSYINIEVKEEVERKQLLDANTFSYHVQVKSDLEYAIFKTKTEEDNNFIQIDILLNYDIRNQLFCRIKAMEVTIFKHSNYLFFRKKSKVCFWSVAWF